MVRFRWASLLLVAALGGTGGGASSAAAPPTQEILRLPGTPVLTAAFAGPAVLWGNSSLDPPVLFRFERGASRPIWRGREVALPEGQPVGSHVMQSIAGLSASRSAAAFVYRAGVALPPGCDFCYRPLFSELWVGPPRGPFRRVRGLPSRCRVFEALDAAAADVLVAERPTPCGEPRQVSARIVSVPIRPAGRRSVLAQSRAFSYQSVAAAGRYVAWDRFPNDCSVRTFPCSRAGVVLYDRRSRAVALRLNAKQLRVSGTPSFSLALQPDGKLAVASIGKLAWTSPSSPRPHFVPGRPLDAYLAASADWFVFLTRDEDALQATDVAGRRQALDTFDLRHWFGRTLDASGGRVLWTAETDPLAPSTAIFVAPLR
jgi:hypothetical protein